MILSSNVTKIMRMAGFAHVKGRTVERDGLYDFANLAQFVRDGESYGAKWDFSQERRDEHSDKAVLGLVARLRDRQ